MFKNIAMAALAAVVAAGLCLAVAAGGCGRVKPSCPPSRETALDGIETEPKTIMLDNGLLGQLREPATVRASLRRAAGGMVEEAAVSLPAGTWLVPEQALAAPEEAAAASAEAKHE